MNMNAEKWVLYCLLLVNVKMAYSLGKICPWVQKSGQNIDTYVNYKNIRLIPMRLYSQIRISPKLGAFITQLHGLRPVQKPRARSSSRSV